ncbi:uncharacterized protein KLLA0_C18711g [Kluyveromyces lactis]|uniref:KLLA0C18711p n=1 Tax=Kluyveromyces lactis (strain ATCC 8585 / CBS 2359 / DSM 70799 / NBRC 1267 / NRRL Y-1140 / WM37) TaxID=284590 RepID=B5FV65_KLULA|nr:uncharacterized protein KLLA0_C18711g [Kluyveromyces lactis]CAR64366.1 KLLA0C18711p [Kluyveromyces lactis]|eukprot:XP_002999362.1 uncharacterized protein KLLA0_C18711g [Kluyveromyces lactis]
MNSRSLLTGVYKFDAKYVERIQEDPQYGPKDLILYQSLTGNYEIQHSNVLFCLT